MEPVQVEFVGGYHDGARRMLTEFRKRVNLPIPPDITDDPCDPFLEMKTAAYEWNGSITDSGVRIFVPIKRY